MRRLAGVALFATMMACNQDARAERDAFNRVIEQEAALATARDACERESGRNELHVRVSLAEKECRPDTRRQAAAERVAEAGVQRDSAALKAALAELAALGPERPDRACLDAQRLHEAWMAANKTKFLPCLTRTVAQPEAELKIRKKEYLATCQRCAIAERCEAILSDNERVMASVFKADTPGIPPARASQFQELARENADKFKFGCTR